METSEEASDFFSGSDTEARADTAQRRERAGVGRSERTEMAETAEAESVLAIAGAEEHVRGGLGRRSRRAEPDADRREDNWHERTRRVRLRIYRAGSPHLVRTKFFDRRESVAGLATAHDTWLA